MTLLLDTTIPRTLTELVERFSKMPATRIEAWVFDDARSRQAARQQLAAAGVQATLRSAYKPLLHFLLEEVDPSRLTDIAIQTPAGAEHRFRLEAFPLAGLLPHAKLTFSEGSDATHYVVTVPGSTYRVFAPNTPQRSPCGWLRVWQGDRLEQDGPLVTEFEAAYAVAIEAIRNHAWPQRAPFFEKLCIDIETGGIEHRLPYHDEGISTREALHEDLYFSVLEFFQARAGVPLGDRTLQPGQIIPEIVESAGATRVRVSLRPYDTAAEPVVDTAHPGAAELDDADRPLTLTQVDAQLRSLNGVPFGAVSREGRPVTGIHVRGGLPGLVISAGQHANETSGIVGALRAAHMLKTRHDAHFALIGVENPDGYALHHRLRERNPHHMLHASRYTALGDDLEARRAEPFGEMAVRLDAIERTQAGLHISMHGYPAHEWTRVSSGYIPQGFEHWTIPKGFFLILRHHKGLDGIAFLEALTAQLATSPELAAFNAEHLRTWHAHAGEMPYPVLHGIPCMIMEDHRSTVPFTLVTEYPDQTIYDSAFRLAHTTQARAASIAADLYWSGLLDATGSAR
ncbi:hypothetical protein [Burkholderia sp. Ac-20353]|uniref:hypothetical protein n=1 Tax=Burkholderia sp. Ac-20353 TaxID=2703894 RepID=UPI00197B3390|nr:hypothetical protein [Burkholderia sp. Ac-20353]MBN3786863.1 hypothetical protein [Burkholderia sp. Ac-20353]